MAEREIKKIDDKFNKILPLLQEFYECSLGEGFTQDGRGSVGATKRTRKATKVLLSELLGRTPTREEVVLVTRPGWREDLIQEEAKKPRFYG